MCELCESNVWITLHDRHDYALELTAIYYPETSTLEVEAYESEFSTHDSFEIKFDYCPKCGRRLTD